MEQDWGFEEGGNESLKWLQLQRFFWWGSREVYREERAQGAGLEGSITGWVQFRKWSVSGGFGEESKVVSS